MSQQEGLTIVEALENLNILSDIDSLDEIEVAEEGHLISHKSEHEGISEGRETYWVHAGFDDPTINALKETFQTVFNYLQVSYEKMQRAGDTKRMIEGINTIMVLVGEAAKKLERFGSIFQRVTQLVEYKKLESFYRDKVIKESYQAFTKTDVPEKEGKAKEEWIALEDELAALLPPQESGVYLLNDLETVKKDADYELFYLKNEDGRNFYTYDLARHIKLACDFGEFAEEYFGDDPLLQIKNRIDKSLQLLAEKLLSFAKRPIEKFYKEAMRYKNMEVVEKLHNTLMALMLASYSKNLIRQFSLKGCHRYFADFQKFLRETIQTREFQKLLIYSAPESQPFFINLIDLVEKLSTGLFTLGGGNKEITQMLQDLNHREKGKSKEQETLSTFLQNRHKVLCDVLKKHPSGPIFKAVDLVREEEERVFDPLIEENLPAPEAVFIKQNKESILIRIPSPTRQEFINRAEIVEEFKEFLRGYQRELSPKKHLLFNFQDRTSWKEHARCQCLEELARHAEFDRSLAVVTLAKHTDFYHQRGPYAYLDDTREFIRQLLVHIEDESSGYYYSSSLKKELFPNFSRELANGVLKSFFETKIKLSQEERVQFIEIYYLLLELKILEIVDPDTFSFTSKDGLDEAGMSNVALIGLIALDRAKVWQEEEKEELQRILFAPTLLIRERVIFPEHFHRLYYVLKRLEKYSGKNGALLKHFTRLYKPETLKIKVNILF